MKNGTSSTLHSKKPEKASPRGPILPKLEQSLVVVKDLKEQPESEFILLAGAGKPTYYAVDSVREEWAGVLGFYRKGSNTLFAECVYTCRTEGAWALVNRSAIRVTTDQDLTSFQVEDAKATETFYESLDPQGWADSKKIAMASMGLDFNAGPQLERPNPTGQYL